jgi:hypothetical protein
MVGRGIALLFHDLGTRRGWVVSSTPQPHFDPGKDPLPIVQEAAWAPGPVWTGAENLAPNGIRSPDRPARSSAAIPTELPSPHVINFTSQNLLIASLEKWPNKNYTRHVQTEGGLLNGAFLTWGLGLFRFQWVYWAIALKLKRKGMWSWDLVLRDFCLEYPLEFLFQPS